MCIRDRRSILYSCLPLGVWQDLGSVGIRAYGSSKIRDSVESLILWVHHGSGFGRIHLFCDPVGSVTSWLWQEPSLVWGSGGAWVRDWSFGAGQDSCYQCCDHFLLLSCLSSWFLFYLVMRWIQSWEALERWRSNILSPSNLQYVGGDDWVLLEYLLHELKL